MTEFQQRVYEATSKIPKGYVTSYASLANRVRSSPRAVAQALKRNPFAPEVPCHRVVGKYGILTGFYGQSDSNALSRKREMLIQEGVEFDANGRVKSKCFIE